jgi:DNA modification methylase
VLDAFLASGTTVIAAERAARRCYRLELDPAYVDTITRRCPKISPTSSPGIAAAS